MGISSGDRSYLRSDPKTGSVNNPKVGFMEKITMDKASGINSRGNQTSSAGQSAYYPDPNNRPAQPPMKVVRSAWDM